MIAATLKRPGCFELINTPRVSPGAGEIRIQVRGCGICASSLPLWQGRPWFNYPVEAGAPGHEVWGVVDAVGPKVRDLSPGVPIAALTYRSFAEYDIAQAEETVRLPEDLCEMPLPGEAIACAVNAFRRAGMRPGNLVAIVGIGFLGSLLTQLCSRAGAVVIALSRRQFALNIAKRCGADYALPLTSDSLSAIREITNNRGCDCVIETGGLQVTLDLATDLVAMGGRLVIAGYHQDGLRQVNMQKWNWLGLEVVNAHERNPATIVSALRSAIDILASGGLDLTGLITHRIKPEALNHAFRDLAGRPDGFLKAVVEF